MTYYIYHIPGIKIGCTKILKYRMRQQRFTEWEILETHADGWLAGDRELELQKEYSLPVDKVHYMISSEAITKVCNKGGKASRTLTFEQAEDIRFKYATKTYTMKRLGDEYGLVKQSIYNIIHNKSYITL